MSHVTLENVIVAQNNWKVGLSLTVNRKAPEMFLFLKIARISSRSLVPVVYQLKLVKAASAASHCGVAESAYGLVSSSGPGTTDQGEGAQGTAAVWADGGGALEEAGGAETKGGVPQSCGGGEEEAAAWGGEGEHI